MEFVSKKDIQGCFEWMEKEKLDDNQLMAATNIARTGFPRIFRQSFLYLVADYSSYLLTYIHQYIRFLCERKSSSELIAFVLNWYRVVVIGS